MEEYLIFAVIGGLLFLTLLVNSVSEAYEQKQREKRLKILRIKQGLDELSDLLESLQVCNVSDGVTNLLTDEIMARLQMIQNLDRNFRGIDTLLADANTEKDPKVKDNAQFQIKDDADFKAKLVLIRRLIKLLNSQSWHTNISPSKLQDFIEELKLLRCEKIFQYYSDKASMDSEQGKYMLAREHYYYISHALKKSTIETHPRVLELIEQVTFMMEQLNKLSSQKAQEAADEKLAQADQSEQSEDENTDVKNENVADNIGVDTENTASSGDNN